MTNIRRGREGEGGGGWLGGKGGGAHRVRDHTYPELSVARATLVKVLLTFRAGMLLIFNLFRPYYSRDCVIS